MFERLYARDLRRLCARDERPGSRTAEKRDELSPSHDEHFPSRVGRIPIWFGLETSMPARGRAGSKSCRLEHGRMVCLWHEREVPVCMTTSDE
jgi:hypothetical protein